MLLTDKNPYRILVIDDDPDIGTMIKIMLEYKGYSVIVAEQAGQAFQLLSSEPVQLIIMDMLLSGKNGIDVCADLKKEPSTSFIPLLMVSAHPTAREMCLQAGADDFISKPFDMEDMLSSIQGLLEGSKIN